MVDLSIYSRHSKLYGSISTAIVLGLLALIFFSYVIRTPNPPYPEDGGGGKGSGIEINLGFDAAGMGEIKEQGSVKPENSTPEIEDNTDDNIVTQDIEDAPVIAPTKRETKKTVKKEVPKKTTTTLSVKEEKKPAVNTNALWTSRKTSDGTSNVAGDQGSPTGDPNVTTYGNGGKGGSGGGSGGGIGTGTGTGTGIGSGTGMSYQLDLSGRTLIGSLPTPEYHDGKITGIVAVEIRVDKKGNVIEAKYKEKGTTIFDSRFRDAAERAALNAKFNLKADAPLTQVGTIYYHFKN